MPAGSYYLLDRSPCNRDSSAAEFPSKGDSNAAGFLSKAEARGITFDAGWWVEQPARRWVVV
jgi:hypothetical protein